MAFIDSINNNFDNLITKPIIDAFEIEDSILFESIEDLRNQFFLEEATYGLDKWESMLGIPKNNFDYTTRRENIKAKMRSRGTTTIASIKNICEAYSNGQVDITVNHLDYSFTVDFIGSIGVPSAFAELDKVIDEIKPCHLEHKYKFNFNTHYDISKHTHEELANYTHEEIRNLEEFRGDNKWLRNT